MNHTIDKLTYQLVGLYGFFPKLSLTISGNQITTANTIEEIMKAAQLDLMLRTQNTFSFIPVPVTPEGGSTFNVVGAIGYDFRKGDNIPPNAAGNPFPGWRFLFLTGLNFGGGNDLNDKHFIVWQYYREVVVSPKVYTKGPIPPKFTIRLRSQGQPKFDTTAIGDNIEWGGLNSLDDLYKEFDVIEWKLIHRFITVPVRPELLDTYKAVERKFKNALQDFEASKGVSAFAPESDLGEIFKAFETEFDISN